jgi:hypothetical protein
MRLSTTVRYCLWCGIVATAEANRRHYRMTTTWLPHLLTNTLALLLPDLYRALRLPSQDATALPHSGMRPIVEATIARVVCHNPYYVAYVAPLAAGYLLSNPRFNIYKGELAEKQLAGFGLDALPHGATALALTLLTADTLRAASSLAEPQTKLANLLKWSTQHLALASGAVLALATSVWELGEYRIHRYELHLRGEASQINMQWSPRDTLYDCLSNAIGWALGLALQRKATKS